MSSTPRAIAEKLAATISDRRSQLGLTQAQVTRRGGPSKPTQIRYEASDIPSGAQDGTLRKYESALELPPGTLQAILDGGEPVIPHPSETTLSSLFERPGPEPVDVWHVDGTKLRSLFEEIQMLRARVMELPVPVDVREQVDEITARQVEILMDHVRQPPPTPPQTSSSAETSDSQSGVSSRQG